ncbi:MAG: ribonuclease H-like domain-containing protein [Patescibacteria group bacterium]
MLNEVVLDLETKNSFSQARDKSDGRLFVSLVGIYRYEDDSYSVYLENELNKLWPVLERADRIIGFNTHGFDFPVLQNYYPGSFKSFPSLDMMDDVLAALGFRVSLNNLAKGTLNQEKSGDGLQAIRLWQEQKIDELSAYCLQDVRLTKELYEYGKKNGILKYESKIGQGEAKVNFSPPDEIKKVNLTLPL